jgi:hypothetical protein
MTDESHTGIRVGLSHPGDRCCGFAGKPSHFGLRGAETKRKAASLVHVPYVRAAGGILER